MPYNPSNYNQSQRGHLDFLFEALGVKELFERVAALDSGDGPMDKVDENPTNDPAVVPNMEGVGTYSGGPSSENDGSLATLDPDYIKKVKELAEESAKQEKADKDNKSAEDKEDKKTTSSTSSTKSTASSSSSTK